jgi:bacillithiol system protein YtxJ
MNILGTFKEFQDLILASHTTAQILFKHSLICPTSLAVYERIEEILDESNVHTLIVQESSTLKMIIAETLDVSHESPQVIVLQNGVVIYNASHYEIQLEILQKLLDA